MDLMTINANFKVVTGEITTERWNAARPLIQRLYIDENKSLSYVANAIKAEFGFRPTKRQFNRKVGVEWALRKNSSIRERQLAIQPLEPKVPNITQSSSIVQRIDQPHNPAKLRRWRKELGRSILSDVQSVVSSNPEENSVSAQLTPLLLTGAVVNYSPKNIEMDAVKSEHHVLWDWTRITESPGLTSLFTTLQISGFDPDDNDIPPLCLSEIDNAHSNEEEQQFISFSDLVSLQTPTWLAKENEPIYATSFPSLAPSTDPHNAISPRQRTGLVELPNRNQTAYTFASPFNDLYPFIHKSATKPPPTSITSHVFFEEKLEKLVRIVPRTHIAVWSTMIDLAKGYENAGQYRRAESLYQEVLSIMKAVHGVDHPETLNTRLSLAYVLNYLKLDKEVRKLLDQLHTAILAISHAHYDLLLRYMTLLAHNEYNLGNLKEAELLDRQILQITMNMGGPKDTNTILAMASLGMTLRQKSHFSQAEKLLRIVIQLQHQEQGISETHKIAYMRELANCLSEQMLFTQSSPLYIHILQHAKLCLGEKHPEYLMALEDYIFDF